MRNVNVLLYLVVGGDNPSLGFPELYVHTVRDYATESLI